MSVSALGRARQHNLRTVTLATNGLDVPQQRRADTTASLV
jgi:hypothetical protein